MTSSTSTHWQVPAALTHATWQAAKTDCQALAKQATTTSLTLDWQHCRQIDSSALAFILDLKRSISKPIEHSQAPLQLLQLAKLYEVDSVLELK
jgi:ABC-type transporter Mla MlaB component